MKHYSAISIIVTVFSMVLLVSCKKDIPASNKSVNTVNAFRAVVPAAIKAPGYYPPTAQR